MIEADADLSLSVQCELVGVSRSSLYYRPVGASPLELGLKHRIDEIYTAYPFYGSRRMVITLQQEGHAINRKRVQRYMREMGIWGVAPGPNLSARRHESAIFPYLLGAWRSGAPTRCGGST